jgi:hypothetical protein
MKDESPISFSSIFLHFEEKSFLNIISQKKPNKNQKFAFGKQNSDSMLNFFYHFSHKN